MVLSPLITKTRLPAFPRKTGLGPVFTCPALLSPETSMCMVMPLAPATGLVAKTTAWEKAPGSPVGLGTGTMNWRKLSLQPAIRATERVVTKSSPSFLYVEIMNVLLLRGTLQDERKSRK